VPFGIKLYAGQKVVDEYKLEQGISGFGNEPVILTWSNPSSGFTLLKIKVDFEQAVSESIYSLSDNSIDIRLTVGEQTIGGNEDNVDSSLLSAPGYLSTFLVLTIITIFSRRKNNI
jgi:hypothetical protein